MWMDELVKKSSPLNINLSFASEASQRRTGLSITNILIYRDTTFKNVFLDFNISRY